jgi:SAM-dependent methyltransferase
MSMSDDHRAPLHQMRPTERFASRAEDYARWRPSYPPGAVEGVLEGLDASALAAADIGAGTGIFTLLLAQRLTGTSVVWALEPSAQMRAHAPAHARVRWLDGSAERTGLAGASADVLVCAQAFHWFRPAEALDEFARVVRPGGRVALVWNDLDERDGATRAFIEVEARASAGHPARGRSGSHAHLFGDGRFVGARTRSWAHEQALDEQGLLGRARSASYLPREGEAWEALKHDLLALHARWADGAGTVRLRYVCTVHDVARE